MSSKVLFLGANSDQIPFMEAAQELGFFVVATDINPVAPGREIADAFYQVGYDDFSGLQEVAETQDFDNRDAVFTAASHFAWAGASEVALSIDIDYPSPDSVDCCLDKSKLYPKMLSLGIPVPPYRVIAAGEQPQLDPSQVYYYKSDYGKSPNYCYRVADGTLPAQPNSYNQFFRKCFLLQEEVVGLHYRLVIWSEGCATFLKFDDYTCVGLPLIGPCHRQIERSLRGLITDLGLENYMVKFDLVVSEAGWFVIDLGLDPPMRLHLLSHYRGVDFPSAYTTHYLAPDKCTLPKWRDLSRTPVLVRGIQPASAEFTELVYKADGT